MTQASLNVPLIFGGNSAGMEFAPSEFGTILVQLAGQVLSAASQASPVWLLAAFLLHGASILCRVRIWQKLLRAALPQQAVPFSAALTPYLASVGASVVAPFRGGDAVRIGLARRTLPEAGSAAVLGTLAAEAIPGVVMVPLLVAAALLLGVLPFSASLAAGVMAGGAVLALCVWRIVRLVGAGHRGAGRMARFLADLASGLRLVGSPGCFARLIGPLAVLDWVLRIAMMATLLAAFHLGLDTAAAVAVVSIDSLTTLVPVLPNGAGAQQAAIAGALNGHASATALVAFSAGTQLLVGAVNVITGALALAFLPRRTAPVPVLAAPSRG
jgi:uncharacterized membrane protein YbhN (UPF0104 family)